MNPYDEVPYPSQVFPQTHPDRLAMVAALHGLMTADPLRCRMLDLGCGDGMNVLACAQAAPESEFLGVELAEEPVLRGNRVAADAGLRNVRIVQGDVTAPDPAWGTFDYVVSHGVYAWVPPAVRDGLMATLSAALAPGGVGYVSYCAKPGGVARSTIRQMLLVHGAGAADSEDLVRRSHAFLRLFRAARTRKDDAFDRWLLTETEERLAWVPEYLRHDDLGEVNQPAWFGEFAQHAARHGLDYLAEADWPENADLQFPDEVRDAIASHTDPVEREQFRDLMKCRRFRETLVVREGTAISREKRTDRIQGLLVAGEVRAVGQAEPLHRVAREEFAGTGKGRVTTDAPIARAALRILGAAWPRRFRFETLLADASREVARARAEAPADGPPPGPAPEPDEERRELTKVLSTLQDAGILDLHAHAPVYAGEPGERPVASPLARVCARSGQRPVSLLQQVFDLADLRSRLLLTLLDGTHDRTELLACLLAAEAPPAGPPEGSAPLTAELLDRTLDGLARRALLLA